ncbi:MAG: ABC transporter permease [Puniceicoccales bacterium]|nr:ABC transporter permease [Puniceicoccales bacterium]
MLFSPIFLALGTLFLLLNAAMFLAVLQEFTQEPHFVHPTAHWLQTFWIGALLVVPLLSMRSIAEERSGGTLDGLLSIPLKSATVVGCKFCALWAHYLFLWMCSIGIQAYAGSSGCVSFPFPFFSSMEFAGGMAFLAMAGALHLSLGLLFSAVFRSTTMAGAATFVSLLSLFFGPRILNQFLLPGSCSALRHFLSQQDAFIVLEEFTTGIFDSQTILLHISLTISALVLAATFLRRP